VIWDFGDGGYCCPQCGSAFEGLGDHTVEQIDWQVLVRVLEQAARVLTRQASEIKQANGMYYRALRGEASGN
jgi:hypothetical protein